MITIAVHTRVYALGLKKLLESNGINVSFEEFKTEDTSLPVVKIDINEKDLPFALKVLESGAESPALERRKLAGVSNKLLIPVDFSDMSRLACKAGFELAVRLELHPVLLYAYATPFFANSFSTSDPTSEFPDSAGTNLEDVIMEKGLQREANIMMRNFVKDLKSLQKKSELPDIPFSCLVEEGVAEDVILNYTRQSPPVLVVMATRGRDKREQEMVGSVTAEVIDSCRVPLFTVPENYSFCGIKNIVRLAVFCNLDQQDIRSVDTLMRMFSYPEVDIWLIPVNDKAGNEIQMKLDSLRKHYENNYPTAKFHTKVFGTRTFRSEFENLVSEEQLQMIIVPNKKKNIFSRLFNPGIAHKLLFERDIPMLALPV